VSRLGLDTGWPCSRIDCNNLDLDEDIIISQLRLRPVSDACITRPMNDNGFHIACRRLALSLEIALETMDSSKSQETKEETVYNLYRLTEQRVYLYQ
jgi:hypothetical protein